MTKPPQQSLASPHTVFLNACACALLSGVIVTHRRSSWCMVCEINRTWDDLIARMSVSGDYHFIAPTCADMANRTGSGLRIPCFNYLYDLRQLIEQNNFEPVSLVGHSLGGAIAAFLPVSF